MKLKNCKKITSFFLTVALISTSCFTSISTVMADDGNLALNKPVYSGGIYHVQFSASNAVDGAMSTHWASGSLNKDNGVSGSTIIVDLESEYDIDTVIIRSERDMDRGGYTRAGWSIYVSKDFEFKNPVLIGTKTTPGEYGEDLEIQLNQPVRGRYVKVASTTGLVLSEIEVYGEIPKKAFNNNYSLKNYIDLEGSDADRLIPYLGILEGINGTEFSPLDLMKRKDAVKSVLSLINFEPGIAEKCFEDVDVADEYSSDIYSALSLGIISHSQKFRPDDYVTISEFYSMILRALGYGEYTAAIGDYPTGALVAAQKIGLDKDAELDGNEYVNRKSALNILYNALVSNVMEGTKISENGMSFKYGKKNETVLEKYFHMNLFNGVVTANNASTLNDLFESNLDNIVIGNKVYRDLTLSAYGAIGKNISFVVDSDDGNGIMAWWENIEENKVYEIDCADLDSVTKDSIQYYVNGTMQKKTLNIKNADVLKNGSACYDYAYNLESFKQDDSYIIFIDNNSDGVIEVVNIMQPMVIPIDTLKYDDNCIIISGKNNDFTQIDAYDNVDVMINGIPGKKRFLNNSSVIYAYLTPNNKNIALDGYATTTEKKIDAISSDSVTIEGEEYEFSDFYIKNKDKMGKLIVGAVAKCIIGKNNKLVWVEGESGITSLENLGFIMRTDTDKNKRSIRIFTEDSKFVNYELADKIKIDGTTLKSNYVYENSDIIERKYAIYKLDSEQKIKWIDTETYDPSKEADSKMYKVDDVSSSSRSHANAIFNGLKMLFPVKDDTKVFVLPWSKGEIMTSPEYEKYYRITQYPKIFSSVGVTLYYTDAFYMQDENGFPLFASRMHSTYDNVTFDGYSYCSKYSPCMVVTKVTKALNTNSDIAFCISGYNIADGSKVKYYTSSAINKYIDTFKIFADGVSAYIKDADNTIKDTKIDKAYLGDINDIKVGDIIKYQIVDNMISGLEKISDRNTDAEYRYGDEKNYAHVTHRYLFGEVNKVVDGVITYTAPNGVEVRELSKFNCCFVYENTKDGKGEIKIVSPSKLAAYFKDGQRCVVYLNGGRTRSLVLYN